MKKILRVIGRIFGWFMLLFLLYVVVVLTHGTWNDWQPEAVISVEPEQHSSKKVIQDSIIRFATWNVGYGGLGAESNFFFDNGDQLFANGRMVRTPLEFVEKNIAGAKQFLKTTTADFFLFQEVDYESKRSYFINQFKAYQKEMPSLSASFSANYDVERVPIPILEPWRAYGETHSGLATLSAYEPSQTTRLQLPGKFDWPTRIFQLDRCVMRQYYSLENGKQLAVFNVHNSAYDKGGELKKQQMAFLRKLFMEEYEQGNYVIVGGDWNQVPPNFSFDKFRPGDTGGYSQINIANDAFPADWQWVYDPETPSNRKCRDSYDEKSTFITLIDFFLISPNVRVKKVKGINQNFQFSDHQPVWMEVELLD